MHSNIALAKSYSQIKTHLATAGTTFTADLGGGMLGSTASSGTIDLVDSSGGVFDANFCHIAFQIQYADASNVNSCFLLVEPSGTSRTNSTDDRNTYAAESAAESQSLGSASATPGVMLYPVAAKTGQDNFMVKDEHTWHFPIGSITQFKYDVACVTQLKPGGNTHVLLVVTYGKEYPENVRAMLNGEPGV